MNIFVIEDEPLAAGRIGAYIERFGESCQQVGWAQSIAEAAEWLQEHPAPDLILSDIELQDGNVFELFDTVTVTAPVIFATAYDQYLLKAFQSNGIGYLLKPYTYENFAAALEKVRLLGRTQGRTARPTENTAPADPLEEPTTLSAMTLAALRQALGAEKHRYRERLTIKRSSGISLLNLSEVALLFSEDKVSFAIDGQGKRHALSQSLTLLESELDPRQWFRANRGQLISLAFVERLEPYGRDRLAVHLRGIKDVVVASRERTPELRRWVEN